MSQVQAVELVLPRPEPAPPPKAESDTSAWWIAGVVVIVLIGNGVLVWYRIKGRDPLKRAYSAIAGKLGLSRAERRKIDELARSGTPAAALLLSEAAIDKAAGRDSDPVLLSVKAKVRSV